MDKRGTFFMLEGHLGPTRLDKWGRFSLLCGCSAVVAGFIVLLGWAFNIGSFKSFLSDGVSMKVNTAQLLILSGSGLVAMRFGLARLARAVLAGVILFCCAIIFEHVSGVNLQIDELLYRDHFDGLHGVAPGRTSMIVALYLILCSVAMLLSSYKKYDASQFTASTLIGLIYISMLGHLFHFVGFYFAAGYSLMEFNTTVSLLALAAGTLLLTPEEGWIKRIYRRLIRKNLFVYIVSYIMAVAPLFAAMYLFVIKNSAISPASDMLVLFMLTLVLSVPVVYFMSGLFTRLEQEAKAAHEQLSIAILASGIGAWDLDLKQGKLSHSEKFAEFFAMENQEMHHMGIVWSRMHPADAVTAQAAFQRAVMSGQLDFQARILSGEKGMRWLQFYGETRSDRSGTPYRLLGTAMDITARKELERQKDEFISVASHELKTPLTSLKTYVQVANRKSLVLEDQRISGLLNKAEIQINKMTRMINDFLNAAQSEAGKMVLKESDFYLDELVREVINDLAVQLKDQQIHFEECPQLTVRADREKIERVLINLIGNAIKYSIGHLPVNISCQVQDKKVIVSIRDQGVGISEQDRAHLFDRFYRAENPNTRTVSGFGIGLYLSAEIIRLHQGHIGVESQIGQGSTFWFDLPLLMREDTVVGKMVLS